MTIDKLIDEVIAIEGDYSNHPADRGGPTRWGVTEAVARRHGYAGDMRDFPYDEAVAIYKRKYCCGPASTKSRRWRRGWPGNCLIPALIWDRRLRPASCNAHSTRSTATGGILPILQPMAKSALGQSTPCSNFWRSVAVAAKQYCSRPSKPCKVRATSSWPNSVPPMKPFFMAGSPIA